MGPLFALVFMAVGACASFVFIFLLFRLFLSQGAAIRYAFGFVVGGGSGAAFSVLMLALIFGAGVTLTSTSQITAYLSTVALGALVGAVTLSRLLMRRFPVR
jgi:hypothetical protein